MKKFVLDTNVLINDPLAIYKFGDSEVVIPLIVLEEIDNLKKFNDNRGQAARTVARELDALRDEGQLHLGVPLPTGGTLRVLTTISAPTFTIHSSPIPDHFILQNCIDLMNEQKKRKKAAHNIILVTEDITMRLIADSLGIEVQRYKKMAVEDVNFYDQFKVVDITDEDMSLLYQDGYVEIDQSIVDEHQLYVNEYLIARVNKSIVTVKLKEGASGFKFVKVDSNKIYNLKARNREQQCAIDALLDENIKLVVLSGKAGTGKTLIGLAAGLQMTSEDHKYKQVVVSRPTVSLDKQHDIGFLPGSLKEKMDQWMGPIYDNLEYLFKDSSFKNIGKATFDDLEHFGKVKIEALQYIRGRSMPNQFILIDEAQNLTAHDIATIITRAGEGTKIVFTGDPFQIDSAYLDRHNNGMTLVIDAFKGQYLFAHVTLLKGERSELAELGAKLLT